MPAIRNSPPSNVMSAAAASRKWPASRAAFVDDLGRGFDDRLAARHDRARAAGAAAGQQLVAVALDQVDQLERQAEPVGQHLGEGRGVALAVVEGAGDQGDPAVLLEADAAHLRVGGGGDLEIAGEAAPAQPAARLAIAGAVRKSPPSRPWRGRPRARPRNRRCRSSSPEAAVAGHRAGRDQVLAPQLDRVVAGLARGGVDQPLHDVVRLRPAGAAIGADRHGVGERAPGPDRDHRRPVEARQVLLHVDRRASPGRRR